MWRPEERLIGDHSKGLSYLCVLFSRKRENNVCLVHMGEADKLRLQDGKLVRVAELKELPWFL
jgi:hypothetical protein